MFRCKCSLSIIAQFTLHVFHNDDTYGLPQSLCDGNQLRTLFHKIFVRGGAIYSIFMGTKQCVYWLRWCKQISFNFVYGFAGKIFI